MGWENDLGHCRGDLCRALNGSVCYSVTVPAERTVSADPRAAWGPVMLFCIKLFLAVQVTYAI